jgi:aminopeptidase N
MVAQWFPKLARLEPDGRWAHFTFHHLSEFYADFGDYDVTVDTPGDMVVGATGKLVEEVRLGDRVARRFRQGSVHDFAFTAWSKYREITALGAGNVAVRVLYPPGYDAAARDELATVRFGLDYLGRAYGRYPYATLTVVHPPAAAVEAGGMEYPTLITTGGNWFLPWTGTRVLDLVTIHELGHQWFYGLVATNEHDHPFLDEGINSYAEIDATEARAPHASAARWRELAVSLGAVYRAFSSDAERNAPVAQPAPSFATGRDYAALVYERTETILQTLANVYGEDVVRGAVGRYARRYRFRHPGPEEFLEVMRESLGDDAATQLRAALFDRATVDYAVSDLESSPDAAAGGYRGSVLLRRRGALRFPVDVDMVGADGSVQRVRWDAAESSVRLPYKGRSELSAAVVDPEHRVLLDDDLGNNAMRIKPARLSGGLLDRLTFAVEAALSGVLP